MREGMLERAASLAAGGVQTIALLALSDAGAPVYDHDDAAALHTCTPDLFGELMAAAIERRDIGLWAGDHGL